ncbi:MAG: trypsin-like serine protease [Deltaproteobacteria bacterium]|nr:trypsin-like serine protease [Deltaproteobacteria bacterium]MBI3294120.1 trypsin-like serine protease [Deltaproteobacteria bacterium]
MGVAPKKSSAKDSTSSGGLVAPPFHDLGLVKFSGGLPPGFKKATLLPSTEKLLEKDEMWIAGYGCTNLETPTGQGILRTVDLPILEPVTNKIEMSFQQGQKGACYGDSGGPAFAKRNNTYFLVGVGSRMYPDKRLIYTRIDLVEGFARWIQDALRN